MNADGSYDDRDPITWIRGFPVYLTTVLVGVHVLAMIFVAFLMALGQAPVLEALTYSSENVISHFAIWEFFSYAFVNRPSLWFAIEMYLLLTFGSEVEKRIGHRGFGLMYLALLLAIPIVLTCAAAFGVMTVYAGSGAIHFAIFIGFVAIYPTAQIFFSLQARWIAAILLAINSLQALAFRDWVSLSMLWLACGCAVIMLMRAGIASSNLFGAAIPDFIPRNPVVPPSKAGGAGRKKEIPADPYESIDPLLDKISKHGIHSLTKAERQKLEKARALLLERERRR